MAIINSHELAILEKVIDEVLEEYIENRHVIFSSDAERAKYHFGDIKKSFSAWNSGKKCMVPHCNNRPIKRSHTLPNKLSLSSISEQKHLLTPSFDHASGHGTLKKIGQNQASTFPGFCTDHEALFHGFEQEGTLSKEKDIYLQMYRGACHEQFRAKYVRERIETTIKNYCVIRNRRLESIVNKRLRIKGLSDQKLANKIELIEDPIIAHWATHVEAVRSHERKLTDQILPAFEKVIFSGEESETHINAFSIDIQIPVALSGGAVYYVNDSGVIKPVTVLVCVFPSQDETLLMFGGHRDDEHSIDAYISTWATNPLNILSMVESWMVNGTDQWYLKPSIWSSLPSSRKEAILERIFSYEDNIGQEYALSIFDDTRRELLKILQNTRDQQMQYHELVDSQNKKMI